MYLRQSLTCVMIYKIYFYEYLVKYRVWTLFYYGWYSSPSLMDCVQVCTSGTCKFILLVLFHKAEFAIEYAVDVPFRSITHAIFSFPFCCGGGTTFLREISFLFFFFE